MSALDNLRPLAAGEYDLVNISLLGYDPITGRSFDECNSEWKGWLTALEKREKSMRWWQLGERFRIRFLTAILAQRMGIG